METIRTFKLFSINCCIHWSATYLTYFVSISVWKCEMKIYLHHLFWSAFFSNRNRNNLQISRYLQATVVVVTCYSIVPFDSWSRYLIFDEKQFRCKTLNLSSYFFRETVQFKAISHSFSSPSAKSSSTNVNQKISPLQSSV